MKKLLLTLALAAAVTAAYAQGTVQFVNSALTRVTQQGIGNVPTTAAFNYGLFWGTSQTGPFTLVQPLGTSSTATAGLIGGGAGAVYAVTGSTEGQSVWLQVKGWDASFGNDWLAASTGGLWFGQTDVRQVTLGPTAGPGTVIWQTASGTNPNRFNPLVLLPVPEPSTLALAGLGAAALMIFRRRN